jgi:hypothetical protein
MAKLLGTGFLNVRSFVEGRFPDGSWDNVLAALAPEDRIQVRSALAVGWYDLSLFARTLRAMDRVAGQGDLGLLPDFGRFDAERDLQGLLRLLLRIGNPAFVMEQGARLWGKFQDSGRLTVERLERNHCRVELVDWGQADGALCLHLGHYFARLLELVGADGLRHRHAACRVEGAPTCSWDFEWR